MAPPAPRKGARKRLRRAIQDVVDTALRRTGGKKGKGDGDVRPAEPRRA